MGLCSGAAERVERFVTNRTPHGPDRKSPPSLFSEAAGCPNQSSATSATCRGWTGCAPSPSSPSSPSTSGSDWAPGGLLGVGVFFTLSGYLITDILLAPAGTPRPDAARQLLARPRPPPAAGAVRDAHRRHRLGDDLRPRPARPVPRRGRRPRRLLRQQLVADLRQTSPTSPASRRRRRSTTSGRSRSRSSSTSSGRSCCCSGVKLVHERPLPSGVRPRLALLTWRWRARLGDPDGGPLPPEPRPLAGLLRHRHARRLRCCSGRPWRWSGRAAT